MEIENPNTLKIERNAKIKRGYRLFIFLSIFAVVFFFYELSEGIKLKQKQTNSPDCIHIDIIISTILQSNILLLLK